MRQVHPPRTQLERDNASLEKKKASTNQQFLGPSVPCLDEWTSIGFYSQPVSPDEVFSSTLDRNGPNIRIWRANPENSHLSSETGPPNGFLHKNNIEDWNFESYLEDHPRTRKWEKKTMVSKSPKWGYSNWNDLPSTSISLSVLDPIGLIENRSLLPLCRRPKRFQVAELAKKLDLKSDAMVAKVESFMKNLLLRSLFNLLVFEHSYNHEYWKLSSITSRYIHT